MKAAWNFVDMAKRNAGYPEKIICPCKDCRNLSHHCIEVVYEHLVIKGMDETYTNWFHHGEQPNVSDKPDMEMLGSYNLFKAACARDDNYEKSVDESGDEDFFKLLEDAETPLYLGCEKYTKLSAIVALYKLKAVNEWSDNSFNKLLEMLHDMLPMGNVILKSVYSVKKFVKAFDLGYKKIHACVNDCCLFRKENAEMESCPKCDFSRWKVDQYTNKIKKGVPAKVLRYFPVIPRFRRMFRLSQMAEDLRWHSAHKNKDSKMRHPVDSCSWDLVNNKWPLFSSDPRNLRLGLAADGFNPFRNLSSTYSCWPVMLVAYNLPPWLCMKRENVMLTLLIPGKKQPRNDIDVYLQPLIEDLKTVFNLRAILLWTINDFPAYGNLSGCSTKGRIACPICGNNTYS
ncbi:uncharacterized protein LOC114295665 [Camellia sinensis]|uniref:uncharacterized protein LOC114295665 n=1 Tax=Camellia sinensis TaxID=4442 RepID=UPI001036A96F|nr:uncharacterized protein LOC114295665 [Camellia sinensis]